MLKIAYLFFRAPSGDSCSVKEVKMIGAIAGDMVGSPYESYPIKYHREF